LKANEKNITALKIGEVGFIKNFTDKVLASKLITMGALPNSSIELVRKTLFNTTYYIKINHTNTLALRKSEAANVLISE
jgi:Fe2+ transport system protein FeoA